MANGVREVVTFLPDLVRMLRGVLADERVPARAKLEAGAAVAYLLSPLDRLTDWIPVVGQLEDAALVAFAVRKIVDAAGEDVLREHWSGSERGFAVVQALGAAGSLRPRRLLGAVVRNWSSLRTAFEEGAGTTRRVARGKGHGGKRVVDGEVLGRRPSP